MSKRGWVRLIYGDLESRVTLLGRKWANQVG